MRPLILFLFVSVFYFISQAQIDFNTLIDEGTQQQNITATEVHRFAGVNADRTPADYSITVASESDEFDVKLKKVEPAKVAKSTKKANRKPASKKATAAAKETVKQKGKKKKL